MKRIVQELGVNVTALESVPTAIFCFLKAQKRIRKVRTDNPLRRAIQYAVSCNETYHGSNNYYRFCIVKYLKMFTLSQLCHYFTDHFGG